MENIVARSACAHRNQLNGRQVFVWFPFTGVGRDMIFSLIRFSYVSLLSHIFYNLVSSHMHAVARKVYHSYNWIIASDR